MASILKVDTIQESTTNNGVNFSHPVELASGTAAAPGMSFTSDPDTGLYRISEDKIGVAVGGSRVGEVGAGYGGFTGNIIQVSNTTYNTTYTYANATNTPQATGFKHSFSARYSNSRLVHFVNFHCAVSLGNRWVVNRIRNNTTSTYISFGGHAWYAGSSALNNTISLNASHTVSNTTSNEYEIWISGELGDNTITFNQEATAGFNSRYATWTIMEIQI